MTTSGPDCIFHLSDDLVVFAQFLEFPQLSFSHWRNLLGVEGVLDKRNEEYFLRKPRLYVIHDQ